MENSQLQKNLFDTQVVPKTTANVYNGLHPRVGRALLQSTNSSLRCLHLAIHWEMEQTAAAQVEMNPLGSGSGLPVVERSQARSLTATGQRDHLCLQQCAWGFGEFHCACWRLWRQPEPRAYRPPRQISFLSFMLACQPHHPKQVKQTIY